MTENAFITGFLGDTEVTGASRSRLLGPPMRSLFPRTLQKPELLPAALADCPTCRELTKSEEEETIIINRPGTSTYPEEKSVLTSGATPVCCTRAHRVSKPFLMSVTPAASHIWVPLGKPIIGSGSAAHPSALRATSAQATRRI